MLGLNAYRFSFEWSRVQPVEPPWVGQYHAAREAARAAADDADRIRTRGPQPAESRDAFEARIRAMRDEAARQETVATHMLDAPPRPEDFAADAVARYREMVDDLLRRGMTPIVTLSHMTLPLWVQSPPKTSVSVWIDARGDLQRLHVGVFTGLAGTFRQTTNLNQPQRTILTTLAIAAPPRILDGTPTPPTATNVS